MNSFTLTAIGNLARNPEAVAKGDVTYTRFLLVGNDYAGKDDEGASREIVTSLWFVAFGALAESLVRSARKGDQLIVEARVRASSWTDKQGEKQHDHDFVVQGFRFGAPGKIKREERDSRREDGAHRGEERTNGRGSHAAGSGGDSSGANGAGAGKGASVGTGANGEHSSNGRNGASGGGAGSGKGADVDTGANGSAASGGKGASGVANGDANATTGGGSSAAGDAKATNGAKGDAAVNGSAASASDKPAGSRASRRAASPPP